MVVWLIGISGAGKTTLGHKLKDYFDEKQRPSFLLDGDLVRAFYDNDLGFFKCDRIANIKRIMLAAYVLEQNGIIPIVCNISPFEELRNFARKKFHDYHEIYVQKNLEKALQNDVKGVYKAHLDQTALVGIDLEFEEPKHSNVVLDVDHETIEMSFEKIVRYLEQHMEIR